MVGWERDVIQGSFEQCLHQFLSFVFSQYDISKDSVTITGMPGQSFLQELLLAREEKNPHVLAVSGAGNEGAERRSDLGDHRAG